MRWFRRPGVGGRGGAVGVSTSRINCWRRCCRFGLVLGAMAVVRTFIPRMLPPAGLAHSAALRRQGCNAGGGAKLENPLRCFGSVPLGRETLDELLSCSSSRRSGSWRGAGSSLNCRWPSWTAATIRARINPQLHLLQLADDRSQIRSQASGLTPLEGTLPACGGFPIANISRCKGSVGERSNSGIRCS